MVGELSTRNQSESQWKALWKLKVPDSVKYFLWQACLNILPIKLNLIKKKVIDKADCLVCGVEETILHVMWECLVAIDVWGEGRNPLRKWYLVDHDFPNLWMEIGGSISITKPSSPRGPNRKNAQKTLKGQ